ncbi:hypothetical protein ACE1AT_08955 [Pelatocladus sp. BLCC-F211]|uniref:hypothetical protein n=1 Tax=Pelatocladus sp. BLCC-F211 TaxID=3342752 RepID=UPI0035B95DE4
MNIKLNFINQSNDISNSQVLIFQKNIATNFGELAIAWRVIKNCGVGCNHPFVFPMQFTISSSDSNGNFTPQMTATNGQKFAVEMGKSGHILKLTSEPTASPSEVELKNKLQTGSVSANIFKDGKLLAKHKVVSPGQKAVFQFQPKIFIGVVSDIQEGDEIHTAVLSDINTEFDLLGISSADIIMTGGGGGPSATSFRFELSNVI